MHSRRPELFCSLSTIIDKQGDIYQTAYKRAFEDAVNSPKGGTFFKSILAQEVVAKVLEKEPEFQSGPNKLVRSGLNGARGFSPPLAAEMITDLAFERGAESAIAWLDKVLSLQEATGSLFRLLWGVRTDDPVRLTEG